MRGDGLAVPLLPMLKASEPRRALTQPAATVDPQEPSIKMYKKYIFFGRGTRLVRQADDAAGTVLSRSVSNPPVNAAHSRLRRPVPERGSDSSGPPYAIHPWKGADRN